ncbi:MAG: hypothetical protein KBA83_04350, partial [Fermentimonas sp.]|nr:hypothetical protein [Fermentimonas sp.]
MDYYTRYDELTGIFKQGKDIHLNETNIDIKFFEFNSETAKITNESLTNDDSINENICFEYPVFTPSGRNRYSNDEAILLLHGLNERSWSKYLTWAEYLCNNSGKPVILFPISFHINRAPLSWSNPRTMMDLLNFRREKYNNDRSISFANVALSNRLSQKPERFYFSGRQTWADLSTLFEEIMEGKHPLFKEGTKIDIFSYSIGAFLSQIALMTNQKNLYTNTRLFMFCGGSIFNSMQGASRSIMDKPAFDIIQDYYLHHFGNETTKKETGVNLKHDNAFKAFFSMISPERLQLERESFFSSLGKRIKGIALAKDIVIPFKGIQEAMGIKNSEK